MKPVRVNANVEAEESLVGGVLNYGATIIEVATSAGLRPEHFYKPMLGLVWSAAQDLHRSGEPVDSITVANRLTELDLLDRVGGDTITSLMAASSTVKSNAAAHARLIVDSATMRGLGRLAADIADIAGSNDDAPTAVSKVFELVQQVEAETTDDADPWAPIPLGDGWDDDTPLEQPYVLQRTDGVGLLYMGRINSLSGPPESAKSWAAVVAVAQLAREGRHSVYIDLEDRVDGFRRRLKALGVTREQADEFVHYFAPDVDLAGAEAAIRKLNVPIDLVVIDSASEAVVAAGGEINSNDDNTRFGQALRRLAHATDGAAILFIDHVAKNHEVGSGATLGAVAKRRFMDGAAYEAVIVHRFGPGREGMSKLINTKDRHGGVVANCVRISGRDVVGFFHINAADDGSITTYGIRTPDEMPTAKTVDGDFRPTGYMERVSRWLELNRGEHSRNDVQTNVKGGKEHVDKALACLVAEGFVELTFGIRNAKNFAHSRPYREADDNKPEVAA